MSDQGLGEASGQEARPQPGTSVAATPSGQFPWMRNRRVAAQVPEHLESLPAWVVCDRDDYRDGKCVGGSLGSAIAYGCEASKLEVHTDQGGWVVVNNRGQYLRTAGCWKGDARRIRRFGSALAAALAAEGEQGWTR